MIGTILLFLIVIAGLCFILNFKSAGTRIIWTIVFIIVGCILLNALLCNLNTISIGSGLSKLFAIIFIILIGIALIRFINHKRKLKSWLDDDNTSQKKRIDRD